MNNNQFDICIIGGGHAGVEAAHIAAQFSELSVAIVTLPGVGLASTPCNPAIGGVGKGQVVRELDALGGAMSKIADRSAIQFRTLNDSKGYAVQSTRVQVDKDLYTQNAEELIARFDNVTVIRSLVNSVKKEDSEMFHVEHSEGSLTSKKIVVTTGTFLSGVMHTGAEQTEGGRVGAESSDGLESVFSGVKKLEKRFKTGTPARLNIDTIDFSVMDEQESCSVTPNFHYGNSGTKRFAKQISCHLTRTNKQTMGTIRDNKERSPMFNGQITGVGPRYCPSIEDKAFRYPDRNSHHVFVEPEGLSTKSVYPNGVSTSLPKEVQEEFYRSIPGLENVEILVYGYAVEYDVVDTSQLSITLEYQEIPGLYFAGQVNGTSGYEEAAGQGYIAGVNAALAVLEREPFVIDRNESYIGVMVEDLVSNVRDEPYRLFTARNESRLYVREDNSILRMWSYRTSLGLDEDIDRYSSKFISEYEVIMSLLEDIKYRDKKEVRDRFEKFKYGKLIANMTLSELVRRSQLDPVETLLKELAYFNLSFDPQVVKTVAITKKYEGYINRANVETEKLKKLAKLKIDWESLATNVNISNECRQRIERIKPESFSQLQSIIGIRPATLAFVAGNVFK